jgi:pyrroline-5-carboxylate reductase
MKLAFIGYGNMANALINGILASDKNILSDDLYIFHNKKDSQYKLDRCKFIKSGEIPQIKFDIIFLCTTPIDIKKSINENIKIFSDGQIIVSIAAGVTIEAIKKIINKNIYVARAMPNLCALINESITGICMESNIELNKQDFIKNIFKTVGHVKEINENEMHLFTSIFGSGPAYIMYFIESIINSGDFESITSEEKSLLALNLLNSTSKMLFLNEDIKKLRSKVTSKGGTTEAAIKIFQENKLSETIKKAIESAKNKSIEISK